MGKRRNLRKQMRKRALEDEPALVICIGKHCCPRAASRALVEATRAYAAEAAVRVPIVTVGCLEICKHGPIAATYPALTFKKRVTAKRARKLLDKVAGRRG